MQQLQELQQQMIATGMTAQTLQVVTVINAAAKPVYEGDPALKCYIEQCQKEGENICSWSNPRWGSRK